MNTNVVTLYETTDSSTTAVTATSTRQRWFVLVFIVCGLGSWASLAFAIKDVQIQQEPGYEPIVNDVGLWACAIGGWLAVACVVLGVFTAIRHQWHPWKVSLAYLVAGAIVCYPEGLITVLYLTGAPESYSETPATN